MDIIISYLQQGASAIVPFIILLGLLIFVHEMGHFLVAKFFGVRVEVFSLGFGKKIYQFKRGDTTYCISIVPLGGYVKMYGDEPGADIPADQKQYSFTHKPVGQRILVVLAGPLMNFFFAILVFAVMAGVGEQLVQPNLGDIATSSQASKDGFQSGDHVISVNDQAIHSWDEFQDRIETSAGKQITVQVARDGHPVNVTSTPQQVRNKNPMSTRLYVGEVEGLSYNSKASLVAVRSGKPNLAAQNGFRTGDQIESINGAKVVTWRDLLNVLPQQASKGELTITLERSHDAKSTKIDALTLSLNVPPEMQKLSGGELLAALGFDLPDLYLAQVIDKSPAREAGLSEGDHILSVGGHTIQKWDEVMDFVKAFKPGDHPVQVVVDRQGEQKTFTITPQLKKQMTPQGKEEERFILGIMPTLVMAAPDFYIQRASNPLSAGLRGLELSWKWTKLTIIGFVRLIENDVSPKNIGGVISIAQVASRSFEAGLSAFLSIMAIISINLFIVNLLPVPVLDGGHLLFYSLEAIRGRPLNIKVLEIAQQIGLVLLVSLMAFALFNDFSRSFNL